MEPPQNDETSEPEVGTYQIMMFGLDTAADPDTAYLCLFVCSALFLWYLRWKGFGRRDERWRQLVSALGRSCQLVLRWFSLHVCYCGAGYCCYGYPLLSLHRFLERASHPAHGVLV